MLIPQNFYAGEVRVPHRAPALWPRIPELLAKGGLRKAVVERCRDLGLDCIDTGTVMSARDFFPGDAHWNKEGHRKAADLLYEYFSASEGWR